MLNCPYPEHTLGTLTVTRGKHGSATVRVTNPAGVERAPPRKGKDVTTPASGDLDRDKPGDNWYIGIDNREFYIVPGAFVLGGGWAW